MAEDDDIREELIKAREEIAELKLKTTTVLSADHFLALVVTVPLLGAFSILILLLFTNKSCCYLKIIFPISHFLTTLKLKGLPYMLPAFA